MVFKIFAIAGAGALGTLCRFGLTHLAVLAKVPANWGTITANILGSFLFGLVYSLTPEKFISTDMKAIILTGFMGAFTTFSTYMFECQVMIKNDQPMLAFANIAGQTLIGLAAVFGGIYLARLF
ncbi:MAG: fluoride efflux transporter FluC [Planctomycetota bacterium]|jgi:CrcB protein